jgi:diguanylate cyclase (GGDEF)-like protein
MVPIRTLDPIGAIGNYWASPHTATAEQVELLQALADSTSIALENVQVYAELERRVKERTGQLVEVNHRLQAEVRERERIAAEVRQLSLTDELTGLRNRRGFLLLAERELESARRRGGRCLLLYADLDYLKQANDRFGHAAGDAMIVDAAQLLRSLFRSTDVVARLGGDEFVVLASDYTSSEEVLLRLHRALEAFRRNTGRPLSLSVGLAESSVRGNSDLDALLQQADTAMYASKCARRRPLAVNQ